MSAKGLWIGLGIAAAAASVIAVLYAPGGDARRRKLNGVLEEAGEYLADAVDFVKDRADRVSHEAESVYKTAAEAVSEAASEAAGELGDAVTQYAANNSKLADLTRKMV